MTEHAVGFGHLRHVSYTDDIVSYMVSKKGEIIIRISLNYECQTLDLKKKTNDF